MTKLTEYRIKRNAQIVEALKEMPRRSHLEIASQFRCSTDVIIRVATQNGLLRATWSRRKKQVA